MPLISKSRHFFSLKPEVQNALVKYLTKVPNRTYFWMHLVLAPFFRRRPSEFLGNVFFEGHGRYFAVGKDMVYCVCTELIVWF